MNNNARLLRVKANPNEISSFQGSIFFATNYKTQAPCCECAFDGSPAEAKEGCRRHVCWIDGNQGIVWKKLE